MKYFIVMLIALLSITCYADSACSMLSEEMTLRYYMQSPGTEPGFDPNEFEIVDFYHTDIEVSFSSFGWDFHLSHDSPGSPQQGKRIELENGLLYGNSNCYISNVPAGFEFTGVQAGGDIWVLPQNAYNNTLPLGFAAQLSDSYSLCNWNPNDPSKQANRDAKWFRVRLKSVRAPEGGHFSMWQTGPLQIYMSTYDSGISSDDTFYMTDTSHVHINWGFSKAGYYEVVFEVSTVYQCNEALYSDIWPVGNGAYNGDCKVDINDLAMLARYWLENDCDINSVCADADIYPLEYQPGQSVVSIDINDLQVLAAQWLQCDYPGCQ